MGRSELHNPSSAEDQGTKDSTLGWREVGGDVAVERGRGEGSLFSRSKPKPGGLEREVSPFKMPG